MSLKTIIRQSAARAGHRLVQSKAFIFAFHGSRILMRLPLPDAQRFTIWDSFVGPYLSGRSDAFWVRTQFGARIFCSLGDSIQRRLIYFGIWEPNLTDFIQRRLRPGDCFVDVGANIGYYVLLASELVGPKGRVIAIEASPRIFSMLRQNLAANSCNNVRAVNVAAADHKGILRLFSGPSDNIGLTSTMESRGQTFESEVPSDRLEAILSPEELKIARLVKIDVEGAEAPVLMTILDSLNRYRTDLEILVEINPPEVQEHGMNVADILDRFAKAGFHAYLLRNDYSSAAYVKRPPISRPQRIRQYPLNELMDVVFSRIDAEEL